MAKKTINIHVSVFDAGCLPNLLLLEISKVDRQLRGNGMNEEAKNFTILYRAQLKACLAAIQKVIT